MAMIAGDSDNDSDYGWDLSPEDERDIDALFTQLRPPVTPSASLPSTARAATRLGQVGYRLEADIKAVLENGIQSATENTTLSPQDEGGFRGLLDAGAGFAQRHEAGIVSQNAFSAAVVVSGDGEIVKTGVLGRAKSPCPPLPAKNRGVSSSGVGCTSSAVGPEAGVEQAEPNPPSKSAPPSNRSPFARYRAYPTNPFSVTELAAGAWCELQHEYTLTLRGGKKTRTAAMRAGTHLHQTLEDEVHTTVQVQVATKVDRFGVRLWNIIQGLRALRETGLTREMEVWGLVNGYVVNGVVDSLSYENPVAGLEDERRASQESNTEQMKITNFFPAGTERPPATASDPKIYLTDVKTRGVPTLPTDVAVRPAKIQLFLYHRFLSEMAAGRLDYVLVIRRYGLDPDEPFSDEFLAEIGSLHEELFCDTNSSAPTQSAASAHEPTEGAPPELVKYYSLRSLLILLREEVGITFPRGSESIGTSVMVDYRLRARYKDDGTINNEHAGRSIGQKVIPVHKETLDSYLVRYMQWWHGQRAAKGVDIEDVDLKCRHCEFQEICSWRYAQNEERLRAAQEKSEAGGPQSDHPRKMTTRRPG